MFHADGQIVMTKPSVTFRNFANVPNNCKRDIVIAANDNECWHRTLLMLF